MGLTYLPWNLILNFRGFYEYAAEARVQGASFGINLVKHELKAVGLAGLFFGPWTEELSLKNTGRAAPFQAKKMPRRMNNASLINQPAAALIVLPR